MAVYVTNLVVHAGADFSQSFTLEDANSNAAKNLTGHKVSAQMRKHAASSTKTDFTTAIVNVATGEIKVGLTTTQTAALKPGRYVYDVMLTDNTDSMSRVVEGMVLVREGVTRAD